MTAWVAISRGGPHETAHRPWGVYLGGVQIARCSTLGSAKEFARWRFGIERWDRVAPGHYREHIDDTRERTR